MEEKRETTAAEKFAKEKADELNTANVEVKRGEGVAKDIRVTITMDGEEKSYDVHSMLMVMVKKTPDDQSVFKSVSTVAGCYCPACAHEVAERLRELISKTPELMVADMSVLLKSLFKKAKGE